MYHLFRVKRKVTLKQFVHFLSCNSSSEGQYILKIISSANIFKLLRNLKDLIEWMKYFLLKFDGKVTYEDSKQFEIIANFDKVKLD